MIRLMRRYFKSIKPYSPWLLVILTVEGFTAILLWLAGLKEFQSLFPMLIIFTLILFAVISYVLMKIENEKERLLKEFLLNPNKNNEQALLNFHGFGNKECLLLLAETINKKEIEIRKADLKLADYEDYVELWAHEIKLPLSLLTLIVDNQSDSLPHNLAFKLDHVRNQIQNSISQILFYYRIKNEKKDYFLEKINIEDCVNSVLEDYAPLIHEKKLKVTCRNINLNLFTDRRAFEFIIGQLVANSLKYTEKNPYLNISVNIDRGNIRLTLEDNGRGVKECDLPYIFEKGFTGDSGDARKKSTGIGLYLVKQLADDLNIEIEVSSIWECGFMISLIFNHRSTSVKTE